MVFTKQNLIQQLATILVQYDKPDNFMDIMYVYERVKLGYLIGFDNQEHKREIIYTFKKEIAPLLEGLGLFISYKHGGYITYDRKLYQNWNSTITFYFKRNQKGSYFLGYPICCETAWNNSPNLLSFSIYNILKRFLVEKDRKSRDLFIQFLMMRTTAPHFPCTVTCRESIQWGGKLRTVQKKYAGFLPADYFAEKEQFTKENTYDTVRTLSHAGVQRVFHKSLPFLRKNRQLFHLDDHFFQSAEDPVTDEAAFLKLVARMGVYLK